MDFFRVAALFSWAALSLWPEIQKLSWLHVNPVLPTDCVWMEWIDCHEEGAKVQDVQLYRRLDCSACMCIAGWWSVELSSSCYWCSCMSLHIMRLCLSIELTCILYIPHISSLAPLLPCPAPESTMTISPCAMLLSSLPLFVLLLFFFCCCGRVDVVVDKTRLSCLFAKPHIPRRSNNAFDWANWRCAAATPAAAVGMGSAIYRALCSPPLPRWHNGWMDGSLNVAP